MEFYTPRSSRGSSSRDKQAIRRTLLQKVEWSRFDEDDKL